MKRQYCKVCNTETLHNPGKPTTFKERDYRCTQCGHPKRYGAKNYGLKIAGRIIMEPKP